MRTSSLISAVMMIFFAAFLFQGCQKNVDNLLIDEPRVEPGDRILFIEARYPDGTELNDFELLVTGPVNMNIPVTGSEYLIENMVDGNYLVELRKEGHIGFIQHIEFKGNNNARTTTLYRYTATLSKRSTPVAIDHEKGGRFTIPGGAGNLGDIEVIIPEGALPGSGTTEITISPAAVPVTHSGNEFGEMLGNISLVCEPSGITFEKPIQVILPLDPNASSEFEFGGLVLVEQDLITGSWTISDDPTDRVVAQKDPSGAFVSVEIPHFSTWIRYNTGPDLYYRWTGTGDPGDPELWRGWTVIDQSPSLGAGVSGTFTHTDIYTPTSTARTLYCDYAETNLTPQECTVTISDGYSHPGTAGKYIWVEVRYRYFIVDMATQPFVNEFEIFETFEQAKANPQVIEFNYREEDNPH